MGIFDIFKKKIKDGEYREDNPDGTFGIINYKKGLLHGKSTYYHKNGKVDNESNYKDGKIVGERISYFESGKIERKEVYIDGMKNGEYQSYHENGKLQFQGFYKNNNLEGEIKEWYDYGKLSRITFYKNGLEHGDWIKYDKDENIIGKGINDEGIQKIITMWYSNGNKETEGSYSGTDQFNLPIKTGEWFYYHQNGIISEKQCYKNGIKDGEWIKYHDNGEIGYIHNYKDGKRHGKWIFFHEDGEKMGEFVCEDNEIVFFKGEIPEEFKES